jgi:hypothetical protein
LPPTPLLRCREGGYGGSAAHRRGRSALLLLLGLSLSQPQHAAAAMAGRAEAAGRRRRFALLQVAVVLGLAPAAQAPFCNVPASFADGAVMHNYPDTSPKFTDCAVGARLRIEESCELDCPAGYGAEAPGGQGLVCVADPIDPVGEKLEVHSPGCKGELICHAQADSCATPPVLTASAGWPQRATTTTSRLRRRMLRARSVRPRLTSRETRA